MTSKEELLLRALQLRLERATADDCRSVWEWADAPEVRAASFHSDPIPWEEHRRWFFERLNDPQTILWIAHEAASPGGGKGQAIGIVRFALDQDEAVISVAIAPERRGLGLGPTAVVRASRQLFRETSTALIHAYIKPDNAPSLAAFFNAGYHRREPVEVYGCPAEHYVLERSAIPPHELD